MHKNRGSLHFERYPRGEAQMLARLAGFALLPSVVKWKA